MDSAGRRNFREGGSSGSSRGLSDNEGLAPQFEMLKTLVPNLDEMDSAGRRNFREGGSSGSSRGLSDNEGLAPQFEMLKTLVPNLDEMDSAGRRNFREGGSSGSSRGLSDNEGLAPQFEMLKTLVPNLDETEMDERTILEKTEEYVRRINEETQKTMENIALNVDGNSTPCVFSVETEKMEERSFVVKVGWRGKQMAGKVQAMLESCGFDITHTNIAKGRSPHMCTTAFVKVEQIGMTEDQVYDVVYGAAERFGLLP